MRRTEFFSGNNRSKVKPPEPAPAWIAKSGIDAGMTLFSALAEESCQSGDAMKNLAIVTIQIGVLILSAAIFWWHSFYRVIAQQLVVIPGESDPTLGSGLRCLYSTTGYCGEIIAYGESLGKVIYSPLYFWLGIAVLTVGLVMLIIEIQRN